MKNTKILSIAVVLLLITNIALVAFMLMGSKKPDKNPPPDRTKPSREMVEELGMTEQQQAEFTKLKEEHFKNVKPYFDSVKAAKSAFYNLVKDPAISDSLINAFSNRVCEKQAELDKMTLNHFRQVRNIFTTEQQPKYDARIQKMMQRKKDSAAKKK